MTTGPWVRFVGQNIKGTPAMSAAKVVHDLRAVKARADVFTVQEFKWPWYWRGLSRVLLKNWTTFPGKDQGLAHPIRGAQAIAWRNRRLTLVDAKSALLHDGQAHFSDDRFLRAVLLEPVDHQGFAAWFGGTHFVVNGDKATDSATGRAMMATDLRNTGEFLDRLTATGYPIAFELDANIRVGNAAWLPFRRLVEDRGGRFHGSKGVEYLFTIPGTRSQLEVRNAWEIPTSALFTDHEGRGVTLRVVRQ